MLSRTSIIGAALCAATVLAGPASADLADSLKKGTPDMQSARALAFGPAGVLFVGDPRGAAIFAFDTGDKGGSPGAGPMKIESIDGKIADLLGTDAKGIEVIDLAVNPASGKAYLAVSRGRGPDAAPAIVRIDSAGKPEEFAWKNARFAKTTLPNVPSADAAAKKGPSPRMQSITQLGFVDGRVIVAGLSNEEWQSTLRSIPFPFTDADKGAGIGIFHGAHNKFETHAPVRTFAAYQIDGQPHLLAAYTCTPLVKIPVGELKAGAKVKGTTVAELGNGNQPLDMIVYQKGGKDYILMANSKRGTMKISLAEVATVTPITAKPATPIAGLSYDTLKEVKGVQQLARLDKDTALLLVRTESGALNLESLPLP